MIPPKITIKKTGDRSYTVKWADVTLEHLNWDEMLGQIACLTMTGKSFYPTHDGFPKLDKELF
jgi:hypothetical protein